MYTLVSAFGVSKEPGSRWEEKDVAEVPVNQLYVNFRKLFLTLSSPFFPEPLVVDFEIFRAEHSIKTATLEDFLVDIGNLSLETVEGMPEVDTRFAQYNDGFRAGYRIEMISPNASLTAQLPRTDRTDLLLKRDTPVTDMQEVYDNCLVSVNGFFHRTDTDGENVYVIDGGKSCLKSRQNQLGILSFKNIGKIQQIPITESMVFKEAADSKLSQRTYVRLDTDTTNKTVMLVLGGYLVMPQNGALIRTDDNTFAIDMTRIPLVRRFFESRQYLDLGSMELDTTNRNVSQIDLAQFYNDNATLAYLTMSQTFFVVVDTPELFMNKTYLKNSSHPGMFITYQEPKYPLIVGSGRVADYWKVYDAGHWAVSVHDSYLANRVFDTVVTNDLRSVTDSCVPGSTYYDSRGYMLEIGSDFRN